MRVSVATRMHITTRVSIVIIKNGCVFIVDLVMIHLKGKYHKIGKNDDDNPYDYV